MSTPHVGHVMIPQTNAVPKSSGTSSGAAAEIMYCAFKAPATGSYLTKLQFILSSDTAATASTPTTLRVFFTTVAQTEGSASAATTNANTWLYREVAVGAITGDHSTSANAQPYDVPFGFAIPSGVSVLVCQHVAQSNAVFWQAMVTGGDF